MKHNITFSLAWYLVAAVAGLLLTTGATPVAATPKFEAMLVWGTNDEKAPNDSYKPVDAETRKKLESLGLKWKHYYVVKKVEFDAPNGDSGKVAISDKSSLQVKIQPDKKVEVTFFDKKGEECSRRTQTLKPGDMLVHGGNVPDNTTAWLVTLKRQK
jgi:hypothetical protein